MAWTKPAWLKESKHEPLANRGREGCSSSDRDGRGEGLNRPRPLAACPGSLSIRSQEESPLQDLALGSEPPIGPIHAEAPDWSPGIPRPTGFYFDDHGRRINTWTAPGLTAKEVGDLEEILFGEWHEGSLATAMQTAAFHNAVCGVRNYVRHNAETRHQKRLIDETQKRKQAGTRAAEPRLWD